MYREYYKGPFGYGLCLRSTAFITGENSERVRYRIEHQQLIGDFQTHVKNYRKTDSPSQDSFHHQQFTNLLPGYIW